MPPQILNLGIRRKWVISFAPRPLYYQGRSPCIHYTGALLSTYPIHLAEGGKFVGKCNSFLWGPQTAVTSEGFITACLDSYYCHQTNMNSTQDTVVYPKVSGLNRYRNNNNNKHSLRTNIKGYDSKPHETDSPNRHTTARRGRESTISFLAPGGQSGNFWIHTRTHSFAGAGYYMKNW
jgi:hypothetical protein